MSPRRSLSEPLSRFVDDIAEANPESLAHIRSDQILFVAGAARLAARASIRPLAYGGSPPSELSSDQRWRKPRITLEGMRMLYEICLRPRFFLDTPPENRLLTIAHELWHISERFDGTLAQSRRHEAADMATFEQKVNELVERWRTPVRESSVQPLLATEGEAFLEAWLSRPPSRLEAGSEARKSYDEHDLFSQVVVFGVP